MIMLQELVIIITILTSSRNWLATNLHNYNESFKSFGFELLADFHILRIPFMISGGVQTAWKK